ncbi:hypothetical protein OH76DRAFT_1355134 [Lentinus brumalis]|uniref:Uncharacterized protein n=1 Tax=Lentinus brumalis TaxID=2498619 RepID=A0A371D2V5_9APHY|nr:hypothetical protein OH76DRAFT_1355134 [Polyporus brumalis]
MHLVALNLTDLIVSTLRGTLKCYLPDKKESWDFAIFQEKKPWKAHGKLVANCGRYLPGSFDRIPRDPAKKISSGYKAWEFLVYVYGLLPGLLRGVLGDEYYHHFCLLVSAIRILLQHRQHLSQLPHAHRAIIEYVEEFEVRYYQRRASRVHFVRPSLHTLTHIVPEILRVGPGTLYSQWTLENYIGNITREIKQHVTPYANVSERASRRAQMNALKAVVPQFAEPDPGLPQASYDLGDGYALLRARDSAERGVTAAEEAAIMTFFAQQRYRPKDPNYVPRVRRWARLALPSGQVARSAWKEVAREARGKQPRRSRMLKGNQFAEVQYYFGFVLQNKRVRGVAMIAPFTAPDAALLKETHGTLAACYHPGNDIRQVIFVDDILSVVAMVPLPMTAAEATEADAVTKYASRYFVVEKPGLDIAFFAGRVQDPAHDEDGFNLD